MRRRTDHAIARHHDDRVLGEAGLASRCDWLVCNPLPAQSTLETDHKNVPERPNARTRVANDFGLRHAGCASNLRARWLAAHRRLSVSPSPRLARRRRVRILPVVVLSRPQGSRAKLVGHARDSGSAYPGDLGNIQSRSPPDVLRVLALGPGSGIASTELDCGARRPHRFRNFVLSARRARGGNDGQYLWG